MEAPISGGPCLPLRTRTRPNTALPLVFAKFCACSDLDLAILGKPITFQISG